MIICRRSPTISANRAIIPMWLKMDKNIQVLVEKTTAQVTINSSSSNYFAKRTQQTTQKRQKIPVAKKVQPSRLSD